MSILVIIILFGLFDTAILFSWKPCPTSSLFINYSNTSTPSPLTKIKFNNSFVENFAADGNAFYSFITPTKIDNAIIVDLNSQVANYLGILLDTSNTDIPEYLRYKPLPSPLSPLSVSLPSLSYAHLLIVETKPYPATTP